MSYSDDLDRYRKERSIRSLVNEYKAFAVLIAFFAVLSLIAVVVNAIGYPEVAGMIISWNILVAGVLFVFAVVPMYAIRFLPAYHKF